MNAEQKAKQLITDAKQKAQERFEQLKSANFPYELRGVEPEQKKEFWRRQYCIYSDWYFKNRYPKSHYDVLHNEELAILRAWKQSYMDLASGLQPLKINEPDWADMLAGRFTAQMVMQYCDEKIKQL